MSEFSALESFAGFEFAVFAELEFAVFGVFEFPVFGVGDFFAFCFCAVSAYAALESAASSFSDDCNCSMTTTFSIKSFSKAFLHPRVRFAAMSRFINPPGA